MAHANSRGRNSKAGNPSKGVSSARLHQKCGFSRPLGGYTKVNRGNGSFTIKKTGSGK